MENTTVASPIINPSIDEIGKMWANDKIKEEIANEKERIKIAKIDSLRWALGTEVPDEGKSYTSETCYKSVFSDEEIDTIKDKMLEIIDTF